MHRALFTKLPASATRYRPTSFIPASRIPKLTHFSPRIRMPTMSSLAADSIDESQFYKHGLQCLSPSSSMMNTIRKLGPVQEVPMESSIYVKPHTLLWELNGRKRRWDTVEAHASVGVVIYNIDSDTFIIVRQFRPAVYGTHLRAHVAAGMEPPPFSTGFTHELCAGILDKDKSLKETCSEEIHEECGFQVAPEAIQEVTTFLSNTGISGAPHHLFYAQVDNSMKVSSGGGEESSGESIEVLSLPVDNVEEFILDAECGKSPGLMFGLMWAAGQLYSGKLQRKAGAGVETVPLELKPVVCA